MMIIDKTEELLHKFDYKFEKKSKQLIIKLDFNQRITIDFSDSEKIIIKDRLVGWNFLTGMIEMSIKNATLYNFIGAILLTVLFVYLSLELYGSSLVFIFSAFIIWVLLWNIYYLVKAESMKRTLMHWND